LDKNVICFFLFCCCLFFPFFKKKVNVFLLSSFLIEKGKNAHEEQMTEGFQ